VRPLPLSTFLPMLRVHTKALLSLGAVKRVTPNPPRAPLLVLLQAAAASR